MKKNNIIWISLSITLLCSLSTIAFGASFLQEYLDKSDTPAQSAKKSEEMRANINKKLEEYWRMQGALQAVEKMDAEDFINTWFSIKEAANRA